MLPIFDIRGIEFKGKRRRLGTGNRVERNRRGKNAGKQLAG